MMKQLAKSDATRTLFSCGTYGDDAGIRFAVADFEGQRRAGREFAHAADEAAVFIQGESVPFVQRGFRILRGKAEFKTIQTMLGRCERARPASGQARFRLFQRLAPGQEKALPGGNKALRKRVHAFRMQGVPRGDSIPAHGVFQVAKTACERVQPAAPRGVKTCREVVEAFPPPGKTAFGRKPGEGSSPAYPVAPITPT